MENVVLTAYSHKLQTAKKIGIPYLVDSNSTLNEKLGINANAVLPSGTYPNMRYYAIGIGGHYATLGNGNIPLIKNYQHKATDAALYNMIPFVVRTTDNDIAPSKMSNYALRKIISVAGVDYIAYYLRRIDMTDTVAELQYRTINNNVIQSETKFTPASENLNPTAVAPSNTGVNNITGDYICSIAQLIMDLTTEEVAEIINGCEILFDSGDYAIISEVAMCTGVDKVVTITSGGNQLNFNEAICVQVDAFIADNKPLNSVNDSLTRTLDVGVNEPLFNIS